MLTGDLSSTERTLLRLAQMSFKRVVFEGRQLIEPPTFVRISPQMYRIFHCIDGCFSCCLQGPLSLDFISPRPDVPVYHVDVNGEKFSVWSILKPKGSCPYLTALRPNGGRGCALWPAHPIECWAAGRISVRKQGPGTNVTKMPFSRSWRITPPVQCRYGITLAKGDASLATELAVDIDVITRYASWGAYFKLDTSVLDQIIEHLWAVRDGRSDPSAARIFTPST